MMKKKQTKKVSQDQVVSTNLGQDKAGEEKSSPHPSSRRKFLSSVGGITAATIATSVIGLPSLSVKRSNEARANEIGLVSGDERIDQSAEIRENAAEFNKELGVPDHPCNGDEARYPNRIGNYSKGLRHNSIGEVDPNAYNALIAAIKSGRFADFEALATGRRLGCSISGRQRRLVNPESGYAFDLEGTDSHQLTMRAAPAFASAEEAGEMAELYWMALLREVNFLDYDINPDAEAAADDLSTFSDFRGPKQGGQVTMQTLFRDTYPGCTTGPYISQFLLQPVNFGAQRVDMRIQTTTVVDFMTTFNTPGPNGHDSWLDVQNGCNPTATQTLAGLVYCRNGRDLAAYVHIDVLFQAYFVAALNLLGNGYLADAGNPYGVVLDGGAGRPRNPAIDPNGSLAQVGFGTFGGPAIATLVCEPASRALKDVWYQKWLVHRRLRPEEFGGRVDVASRGLANYPINSELFNSSVLNAVFNKFGSVLLPMAFPEGSPMHTAYGSGHATVAGACVTMLKAFFNESAPILNPVVPSSDGLSLVPYTGPQLTVGGELNKIVSNISQGRNIAGVHWRTDATEANKLGEAAAISILRDMRGLYNEPFNGFSLTKFDGTTIRV